MTATLPDAYRSWAALEARGSSPTYEAWATSIADDPEVLALVERLPRGKQQPNLVFASARAVGAPVGRYADLRRWLVAHWDAVERVALARSTQTNEAARCAVLLPVLSRLDGPLALLEVGASAGLCLYPDRYSYRYTSSDGTVTVLDPDAGPSSVDIPCAIDAASVPTRLPEVAWRGGLDLNPLDVTDPDDVTWLRTLVWPEHEDRRRRLDAACALAAADPPRVVRGDLLTDLADLAATAPAGARLVVLHSAVLLYVSPADRLRFVDQVRALGATWLANEGARVLPGTAHLAPPGTTDGRTVLSVDGVPVARTDAHGRSYEALPTG